LLLSRDNSYSHRLFWFRKNGKDGSPRHDPSVTGRFAQLCRLPSPLQPVQRLGKVFLPSRNHSQPASASHPMFRNCNFRLTSGKMIVVSLESFIIFRYRPSVMTCRLAGISLPTKDVLAIRFNPETKQRTLDTLRWRADSLLGKRSQDRRQDNQCAGRPRL
jgi:hypothetical protein